MKTVWKWILGIFIVLVVVGAIAGVALLWHNHILAGFPRMNVFVQRQNGPRMNNGQMPNGNNNGRSNNGQQPQFGPYSRGPMMNRGFGFPMMGNRSFMRFGFFPFGMGFMLVGGLLRLILPLVVLALVAYIFYQLGKHAGESRAAVAAAPAPVVTEPAPAEPAATPRRGRTKKTE
ncbi:MAG TPA: hypothetical protein VMT73_03020 [Anaerolineales bacterium]|nr:hypothetical protein [Anaerolineales bacterium]